MTTPLTAPRALLHTLRLILPDLLRSQPLVTSGLLAMGAALGLMPAIILLIGKWTVDGVSQLLSGRSVNLHVLAGTALLSKKIKFYPLGWSLHIQKPGQPDFWVYTELWTACRGHRSRARSPRCTAASTT